MIKFAEQANATSCLNRAHLDEMLFVLLGRDAAAPATIRFWLAERIRLRLNGPNDPQIVEAEQCAQFMEKDAERLKAEVERRKGT